MKIVNYRLFCLLFVVSCIGCTSHRITPALMGKGDMTVPAGDLLPEGPPENRAYTEAFGASEYLIGPGDVLRISVWKGQTEDRQSVQVQHDGTASFSFLRGLRIGGLTMRQADSLLTKKLSAYIKNLSVDVGVETYNSKKVFLIGATGGGEKTYALEGKTRLLDVVGKVGGGGRISRVRVSRGGKIAVADLHKVWEGGESVQNPILEGGDIIYIPGTEKRTFVTGEVQRPGTYLLPDDATVLEALMQAGGVTNKAAKSKVKIVRGGRVSPIIMSVNLEKIINRGDFERNIILEQDDLIYVPKTRMGSITDTVTQVNPFITSLVFLVGILQLR